LDCNFEHHLLNHSSACRTHSKAVQRCNNSRHPAKASAHHSIAQDAVGAHGARCSTAWLPLALLLLLHQISVCCFPLVDAPPLKTHGVQTAQRAGCSENNVI